MVKNDTAIASVNIRERERELCIHTRNNDIIQYNSLVCKPFILGITMYHPSFGIIIMLSGFCFKCRVS